MLKISPHVQRLPAPIVAPIVAPISQPVITPVATTAPVSILVTLTSPIIRSTAPVSTMAGTASVVSSSSKPVTSVKQADAAPTKIVVVEQAPVTTATQLSTGNLLHVTYFTFFLKSRVLLLARKLKRLLYNQVLIF